MTSPSPEAAATRAFFDRFSAAFATFDGQVVADLFATPGVALGRDGAIVALTSRDEVVRYYQTALDRYRRASSARRTNSTWRMAIGDRSKP